MSTTTEPTTVTVTVDREFITSLIKLYNAFKSQQQSMVYPGMTANMNEFAPFMAWVKELYLHEI